MTYVYAYIFTCTYVHMYTYLCICICIYIDIFVFVHLYVCIYIYICICIYLSIYVSMYLCKYICIHIYIYIYTYICTHNIFAHEYICTKICTLLGSVGTHLRLNRHRWHDVCRGRTTRLYSPHAKRHVHRYVCLHTSSYVTVYAYVHPWHARSHVFETVNTNTEQTIPSNLQDMFSEYVLHPYLWIHTCKYAYRQCLNPSAKCCVRVHLCTRTSICLHARRACKKLTACTHTKRTFTRQTQRNNKSLHISR